MIVKAKNYLNQDGLLALYHAFIYPYFTYRNHVGVLHINVIFKDL